MSMNVESPEAALWSENMKLKSENEWLRGQLEDACKVFEHYDLPEHAFHYRRRLGHQQKASVSGKTK